MEIRRSPKDECYLRSLKTHECIFIQISRETMLLLINNLHKNVRDNCSFINLRVYSEHSTGKVFLALLYPLNYVIFVRVV